MKPSKVRLKRRAQHDRLIAKADSLEAAALHFTSATHNPSNYLPPAVRAAKAVLYRAAIAYAAEVDGEDQPAESSKVVSIARAK